MIETILSGLILAGVSGITFIAYKHHSGYTKIYPIIHYGALLVLIVGTAWNYAVDYTWIELHDFIKTESGSAALQAREELKIHFGWLLSGTLGVVLYAYFLGHLPKILGGDTNNEK